jgi:thiosulfate/3-mercaptopyruvate sulfurtransferase
MSAQPLIDAAALAGRIGNPHTVVVDCRFNLLQPDAGRAEYERGHIPGARYADLDRDLARSPGKGDGRHPLPDADVFAARLGEWGIDRQSTVVVYDEGGGAIAARLWWLLRWLGHDGCRVLDGGFKAWVAAGLPIETATPIWQPAHFELRPGRHDWVASTEEVGALPPSTLLLDVRTAPRYRGEQEPIDPVAGHVPGARNWPFANALTSAGTFRPAAELKRELSALIGGRAPKQVIAMCGSGVTACHLLLAMHVAGLGDGRLYAGSWSEWIRDPARPVKSGAAP